MKPPERLLSAFYDAHGLQPTLVAYAPGRVNLIGGHVDYNEGWVLPAAIDRAAWIAASTRSSPIATIHALDFNECVTFRTDTLDEKVDMRGQPLPAWAFYPAGVAWSLQKHGLCINGVNAVLMSTVPVEAGLSSSAAIEVALAFAWQALSGWHVDRMTLAQICQAAENAYVGVKSGLMDQFASLHGVAGCALFFDCRTFEWEPVPLPQGVALVIADSNIRRSLDDSSYNERRASCEQAVRILARRLPNVTALRDIAVEDFNKHAHALPPVIRRRAEHVIRECARTPTAVERLRAGDTPGFGALMNDGHASLRDLYEVSCPELETLVEIALSLPGCYGARLTGAGFGGCTVNLVETNQTDSFMHALSSAYQKRTGRDASVWVCQAVDGARIY